MSEARDSYTINKETCVICLEEKYLLDIRCQVRSCRYKAHKLCNNTWATASKKCLICKSRTSYSMEVSASIIYSDSIESDITQFILDARKAARLMRHTEIERITKELSQK